MTVRIERLRTLDRRLSVKQTDVKHAAGGARLRCVRGPENAGGKTRADWLSS